ncbi:hypothetical protein [Pseudomonas kurunegalensis]|uniref:hypothetical protein n=1 Tax=Pseudomonas kurunegalensis TaxID=485880 RepID=UPI002363CECB|nr:hypothetical protein [Pseudomonas kurunegalensis]MDD2133450.1 hypothetical protein [Pseudomonas kurunegalensis]
MLFDEYNRKTYKDKIEKLMSQSAHHASWDYIESMGSQLIWFVSESRSLSHSAGFINFFDDHRQKIREVLELATLQVNDLENAHYLAASFLRELSFGGSHDFSKSDMLMFYLFPKFEEINYKYVDHIRFKVPTSMILGAEQDKINNVKSMLKKVEAWENSLDNWQTRVIQSEERLQGVINTSNYLALGKAFDNLLKQKQQERDSLQKNLTRVGIIALIIPALYVILGTTSFITDLLSESTKITIQAISTLIFSIVFEALLLYYFRIIYSQWLIAKHHVLQLSLRHEMCAFVNEYAKSAQDMDKATLSKFENLVFSELSADLNAPPSVYDAVDSIAKVISSLKKPEKT